MYLGTQELSIQALEMFRNTLPERTREVWIWPTKCNTAGGQDALYSVIIKDGKAFALPGISCENTVRTPREISAAGRLFAVIIVFKACFFLCESRQSKLNSIKECWLFYLNYKQEVIECLN